MTRYNPKENRTCLDMETIREIFIDAIKLAGELLSQDTSLDAGQLVTIIHRCDILLGIFDKIIIDFQLPPPFKDDLKQLRARLITWRGHASIHLESNREVYRETRSPCLQHTFRENRGTTLYGFLLGENWRFFVCV